MMMPEPDMQAIFGLNARQAAFAAAYLGRAKYNGTKAALMAGYSPGHPRQSAHQVLKSPRVRHAIKCLFPYTLSDVGERSGRMRRVIDNT